jgi:hypothetical protein
MYFEIEGDNYIKIDNKFYKILYVKVSIVNASDDLLYCFHWDFEDLEEYIKNDYDNIRNIEIFNIKSLIHLITDKYSDLLPLLKPEISTILQFDPDTEIKKLQQQNKETKDLIYHNTIKYTNHSYY